MGVDFSNMSYFAAGDREGYEMCEDLLHTLGKIAFYVGPIGKAQTVKLFDGSHDRSCTLEIAVKRR